MKENIKEKLKVENGITLVALVVCLIVLLILAAVSLSAVFSQDGIFSRAEQATDKYSEAKARETLELCLSDAQMKKYESGLTDAELDAEIAKVGALLPKTDPASSIQQVIVGEYIFEIDRSVPKITDRGCVGRANEVIVTASITQNGNWQNPEATVTGTITKYGGGTVVSSTATATNGVTIPADFPTTGGSYTITGITTDTVITITTKDSEGKTKTHPITVNLVRDTTPPTLSNAKAEASGMKIKISVRAIDNESDVRQINYSVTPETVKNSKGEVAAKGKLTSGEELELTATAVGDYTVTFTATDKAGNTTNPGVTITPVRVTDSLSLAELKNINSSNYSNYIGKKVDYNPTGGGTWRVFYVEDSSNTFGDGAGTIYLKRDYDTTMNLTDYVNKGMTENGLTMMKKLNPAWREYTKDGVKNENKTTSSTFLENEKAAAGLCDSNNWTTYATGDSRITTEGLTVNYAIGSAPIEMWCKAQNVYKNKYDESASTIGCDIKNANGYGYKINNGAPVDSQSTTVVNTSKEESKVIVTGSWQWLASPSSTDRDYVCSVTSSYVTSNYYGLYSGFVPVVSISL